MTPVRFYRNTFWEIVCLVHYYENQNLCFTFFVEHLNFKVGLLLFLLTFILCAFDRVSLFYRYGLLITDNTSGLPFGVPYRFRERNNYVLMDN